MSNNKVKFPKKAFKNTYLLTSNDVKRIENEQNQPVSGVIHLRLDTPKDQIGKDCRAMFGKAYNASSCW